MGSKLRCRVSKRWVRGIGTGAVAFVACVAFSQPSFAALSGKLWIIAANTNADFSALPTTPPDVTFSTDHINFIGSGPTPGNTKLYTDYTVSQFLQSTHVTTNIAYSGQVNPVLHAAVTGNTLMSNGISEGGSVGTYEAIIELKGGVVLHNGDTLVLTHDDGVSLKIDGSLVSGPGSGPTDATSDHFSWNGTTAYHAIDLVYVEEQGGGAQLVFSPAAQIP